MANELGPHPTNGLIVICNPDAPREVRKVAGVGANAWVARPSTFAELTIAMTPDNGDHFASLPTGLDPSRRYVYLFFATSATSLSDDHDVYLYSPNSDAGADLDLTEEDYSISDT